MKGDGGDKRASIGALAVGFCAVGGFWIARPDHRLQRLEVLHTEVVPLGSLPNDPDAAVIYDLKISRPVHDALEASEGVRFQLAGKTGQTLPLTLTPTSSWATRLKLQTGYPHGLESPKLQAVAAGKVIAETDVATVAPPPKVALLAHSDPHLKLYLRSSGQNQYWIETAAEPQLSDKERWRIVARRASFAPRLVDVSAMLPARMGRRPSNVLSIPFPDRAKAVEVEVTKYRMSERSFVVDVPGVRLVSRFGGTAIVVDRITKVRTPIGATLVVPAQYMGPRRLLRTKDPRSATVNLGVEIDNLAIPPQLGTLPRATAPFARLQLLNFEPSEYGLREIRVGSTGKRSEAPTLPVLRTGSLPLRIRVTVLRPVPKEHSVAVLPVEVSKTPSDFSFPAALPSLGLPTFN